MTRDSPWMPRRERVSDAKEEKRAHAPILRWVGVALAIAAGVGLFIALGYAFVPVPNSWPFMVAAGIVSVGLVLWLAGAPNPWVAFRNWFVRRNRPGLSVVAMRGVDSADSALRELGVTAREGSTFDVAIGPTSLEIWVRPTVEPQLVVPYDEIVSIRVGVQPVEPNKGINRRSQIVVLPGSLDVEIQTAGDASVILPLVPMSSIWSIENDDRLENLVERIERRTALPWADAETPPGP
jgi:hypothetical protein